MKKFIISESEKNNIRKMYGIISEQSLSSESLNSPKGLDTKEWSQFFNKHYKLNLPVDGNWMNPDYNKAMERYITEKGFDLSVCKKGDGYCPEGEEGVVYTRDVGGLLSARKSDETQQPVQDKPQDIKMFQDWLDVNHPDWLRGGKLNKRSGYGTFGPNTTKAWAKYKNEFIKK